MSYFTAKAILIWNWFYQCKISTTGNKIFSHMQSNNCIKPPFLNGSEISFNQKKNLMDVVTKLIWLGKQQDN